MIRLLWLLLTTAAATAAPASVRFNRDVRPILSDNCFACHGFDKNKRKADLRLDQREVALQKKAFVPGDADASELVRRIFTADPDDVMPPPESHKSLKPEDKELLKRWIAEGAVYEPHWAYVPPVRPALPRIPAATPPPPSHPIDAFVLDRLAKAGQTPAPRAGARTLIRRLSLDLTGLPPTPAEVEAFVAATRDSPQRAIEDAADRLLASPHYGERMAVPWLDAVRFADTVGYHGDQNQRVFPYRDYVINAFNSNKRFDQFTTEQLAGDLLPHPTTEQLVATGYNRLNMMTREGGAQPGEYLAKYAGDRIRTLGTAFLGSTLGCCECHDHKFDPFLTRDFYSLQAFFADVREWGVYNDYNYTPNPDLRGWSNDHPFPPEIEVDSPFLTHRAERLTARIQLLADPEAPAPAWTVAAAEKTAAGWQTVLRGPLEIASVRLSVPQGKFSLKLNAHKGGSAPQSAAPPAPAGKAKPRAIYKPGPGEVPFIEAFADRRVARFANTADRLSVLDEWKADPSTPTAPHTAVYYFKEPVTLEAGEQLTLLATTKDARAVGFATTTAAALAPAHDSLVAVAAEKWGAFLTLRRELAECRNGKAWTQVTVAQPPRPMRVLRRGNWMDTGGEPVSADIPAVFKNPPAEPTGAPLSRLDLAKWISSEQNPLTARAIVNRLWAQCFGAGLSARLDDLGAQGEPPSHPELLDWLAVEFRESGWDVKHMVRLMVTSATYAQSSTIRPELAEKDPANRLLARQNLRRLEAEAIRDNALAIAGLLNLEDLGGPSIFPPQPAGYYVNLNFPERDYPVQTDSRHLRRSLYMHWQRTFLHPMLANFDAPSREECQADRIVSNTPQQALTLLNDPTFSEAARAFAQRMLTALPQGTVGGRIDFLFEQALARPATEEERLSLVRFHAELLAQKEEPANAWTQVARVVLNVHQTITRE